MKKYHDGPIAVQERSCTDCICLLLFFAFNITIFCFAVFAWTNASGNFNKLTTAYDPDGKGCGVDYPKYPYIYFASPHADSLWVTVCVASCPKASDTSLNCQTNSVVTQCNAVKGADNTKSVQIYQSTITANTVCLPTSDTIKQSLAPAMGSYAKQVSALASNYKLVLLAIPIAIIFTLIVMIIIRFTAKCFVYIMFLAAICALIALGLVILFQPAGGFMGSTNVFQNDTAKIIGAVICFILAFLVFIFVCCFRNRIALASSIVEVSSVFVADKCLVVLVPVGMFILTICFFALWTVQVLGFYSLGTPKHTPNQYPYSHFDLPKWVYILIIVHVFYLFWMICFYIHTADFLVCGTAASWYFRKESPYADASRRYFKHMGSVCKGSFFMALVGFIKFLYELLAPDEKTNHQGPAFYIRKCCDCLCWLCIGKLFDWFNAGAYTYINITGDSYCTSSIQSLTIRARNLASTSVLLVLSIIFTLIIRIGLSALTVFTIYMVIQNVQVFQASISEPGFILILVGGVAFAVSCFFISVYSQSMEAIYTTYLLDAGAGGDSNNCPDQLKDFIREAQEEQHIIPSKPA